MESHYDRLKVICFSSLIFSLAIFGNQRALGKHSQARTPVKLVFQSDNEKDSRLIEAAYNNDLSAVKELIDSGADPNARQGTSPVLFLAGESALCLAEDAASGYGTTIRNYGLIIAYLADHGADVNACNGIPVNLNGPNLIGILLSHGADPNKNAPLRQAISMWPLDAPTWTTFIRSLLHAGADPNARDENGTTVLHNLVFAVGPYPPNQPNVRSRPTDKDFLTLVSLLVSYGARINDTIAFEGDKVCGPAHKVNGVWVCPVWNAEVPHCGFPMEACPTERMTHIDTGVTPLRQAALSPQGLPLVKALLASGADASVRDSEGCSAIDFTGSPAIREAIESYIRTRPQQAAALRSGPPCKPTPPPFKFSRTNAPVKTDTEPTLDKLDLVCYREIGRASRANIKNQVAPEFGGKKVLRLSVDDPLHMLSQEARAEVTREVLFAIGLWRRMCTKCGIANAAVVLVEDQTYVDQQLWSIAQSINDYGQFPKGGHSLLLDGEPGPYTLQAIFANIRTNTSTPLAKYVVVQQSDPSIKRLCAADADRVPAELEGIRDAAQCSGQPTLQPATLQIRVLNGPTHCEGDIQAVVGCEVGGLSVELNAHEFTFVKHGTSEPIFGRGHVKEDLQVVILHETGHWAGIGVHLTADGNIMSEYVEDCRCIDQAVITQLAEPVDTSKMVGNVGLLHRTSGSSRSIQRSQSRQ